ncbi:TauD/TfdA dioxygenase family protein [Candidatus Palauibacter sp.]|uniref:TauD/TfdA dioxygenase family protein n=1 Tax=Candidatus Palauibacter sp. TaxID=3101350 RepID=UPI003B016D68
MRATPTIRPVTPVIGAEVEGVDLGALDDAGFEAIRDALMAHGVLFFRNQDISIESQKALGARFGELVVHPNDPGLEGHPEVMRIHADEHSVRATGERWHSDVSCDPTPPMGSILRMHTVPEAGGDTLFANMYATHEALSDRMKALLDGLAAIHDGGPYYREVNRLIGRDDGGREYPSSEHPVVRTHPVTGRKALFVNQMFTVRIAGLPPGESEAVLDFLFRHVQRPDFHCRFRWRENSIAFWDNRCTQHHAIWDYFPHVRSGYRVTVRGEPPA